jgi:hypothetical protein
MSSVRVTAAGAVIVMSLACFTAPVSACDDRYAKKCEKAAAAEAAAAEGQTESAPAKRRIVRHVRLVASTRSKRTRLVMRTHAPGFATRERGMTLASDSTRLTTLVPESALARRFRGFIDPQPIADNAFEALRKPHLVALNMEPAAAMASGPIASAEAAEAAAKAADNSAGVAAAAKQDRIAPVATTEQAPAVTKQLALADAPAAKPVAQAEAVASPVVASAAPQALSPSQALSAPQGSSASQGSLTPQGSPTPQIMPQAVLTEAPPAKPADEPGRFPVHKLVLALCGALGAASALRFIVRA